jgi:hypothetical protein
MTDKELLKNAAKAAGIECWRTFIDEKWGSGFLMAGKLWNPLTDDGDALRLAVKLDLFWENMELFDMHFSHESEDKYAATRRAIVRAAAEIGKNK